ncbi:glycosyltransferase family 39 protein [Streptomyces kanasensis]|uniref:glycosyltransferase family 39 protein n=1 Tax=Streptomyces kanasensis TaxID=936756 RepID=UPI0036FC6BD2
MSSLSWGARKARIVVLGVAAVAFLSKMALAAATQGPADVRFFYGFARAIALAGPVRIYAEPLPHLPVYNHPPLASWMLLAMEKLMGIGVPFAPMIRFPACLADFLTVLLVFEVVRRRRTLRTATACALGAALCPVLFGTSGYHGNTDSVAVMFALAAAWLLADRARFATAGVAAALCISVKFVPVVVVPLLFVAAWRVGRPAFARFTAGFAALFLAVWGPVLATVPAGLKANVLEYAGGNFSFWGVVQFARWAEVPEPYIALVRGPGHYLVVAAIVTLGAWLAWRRPADTPVAVAVTLGTLLLLSTASGVQYLAWPAAGLFVIGLWPGLAYALVVGGVTTSVYGMQRPVHWTDTEMAFGALGWALLGVSVAVGVHRILTAAPLDIARPRTEPGPGPAAHPAAAAPPGPHPPAAERPAPRPPAAAPDQTARPARVEKHP